MDIGMFLKICLVMISLVVVASIWIAKYERDR